MILLTGWNSGRKTVLLLSVVLVLVALLEVPEFSAPISGDTAIYAYAGRAIAHGQVLYRDVWDFKAPGIYYLFALIFRLLPDSLLSLRLFAAVWGVAAGLLFWLLAKRFFSPVIALLLAGLFLLWTNLGGQVNADGPYPETFMPLLIIVVYLAWFTYSTTQRLPWLLLAGYAAGSLALLKQTGAITLVGVLLVLALQTILGAVLWKRAIVGIATLLLGSVAAVGPWAIYFWRNGAWVQMWQAVFEYPKLYMGTTSLRDAGHNALNLFLGMFSFLSVLYVMVPLSLWLLWRRARGVSLKGLIMSPYFAVTLWALLESLSVAAPLRFYERYLLQTLPAFILLAGIGLQFLLQNWPSAARPALAIALGTAVFVMILSQLPRSLHWIDDRILSPVPTRSESLAAYLAGRSDSSDTIFAWGDPRIPYVTHRSSGVKWINTEPFRTSRAFVTSSLVDQVLSELKAHPPRFFVEAPAIGPLSKSYLGGTEVEQFIQQNYHFAAHVGDADLYEYRATAR